MKKEKLTVLFCQIGTAITYLSLKWFPLPLPLSVAFTKFIIFTYKDSYINQSATFHSDRTNLNIKRGKCDFSFFNISIGHKLSLSLQNLITNPFNYMAFTNNIMIVRHRLLTELVKLWKNGELTTDKIDRLPLELSPRRSKHAGRCCVHKERAVWKYKSLPLLGLDMDDETDELTPLSEYAARAIERANNGKPKDNIMCVIDEACSACVQINYEITDLCRGCTARSSSTIVLKEPYMYMLTPARHGSTMIPASVAASATKAVLITQSFIFLFLAKNLVLSKRSAKMNTV